MRPAPRLLGLQVPSTSGSLVTTVVAHPRGRGRSGFGSGPQVWSNCRSATRRDACVVRYMLLTTEYAEETGDALLRGTH